jgi:hypothetical protein
LSEKGSGGATRFGSLAEFAGARVRQSVNLESGYLHAGSGLCRDSIKRLSCGLWA